MGWFTRNKAARCAHNSPGVRLGQMCALHSVPLIRDTAAQRDQVARVDKLGAQGVSLSKKVGAVGVSLSKKPQIAGIRGRAVLLLDHSGSMESHYRSGIVQQLVERALAFGIQLDVNGEVDVIPFDTRVWGGVTVNVHNYSGVVNQHLWRRYEMGCTRLDLAVDEVNRMAATSDVPLFVMCITDGNPFQQGVDAERLATQSVCYSSQLPVFLKFLAVEEVQYLIDLDEDDDLPRLLDNVNTQFFSGRRGEGNHRPRITDSACTDEVFAVAMTDVLELWIERAQRAGILT